MRTDWRNLYRNKHGMRMIARGEWCMFTTRSRRNAKRAFANLIRKKLWPKDDSE